MLPLIILDIDETLVYASEAALERKPDLMAGQYHVYARPHVRSFIDKISQFYNLAVWTSANAAFAEQIAPWIFDDRQLKFVWDSRRCTIRRDADSGDYYPIKDLKKVFRKGYLKTRVLMVDDTKSKLERQYGNHVAVHPFYGDPEDNELCLLAQYLKQIADAPDFRAMEKRNWRTQLKGVGQDPPHL